jgi:hypothetical protein
MTADILVLKSLISNSRWTLRARRLLASGPPRQIDSHTLIRATGPLKSSALQPRAHQVGYTLVRGWCHPGSALVVHPMTAGASRLVHLRVTLIDAWPRGMPEMIRYLVPTDSSALLDAEIPLLPRPRTAAMINPETTFGR